MTRQAQEWVKSLRVVTVRELQEDGTWKETKFNMNE